MFGMHIKFVLRESCFQFSRNKCSSQNLNNKMISYEMELHREKMHTERGLIYAPCD